MRWTERYRIAHAEWCRTKSPEFFEASGGLSMRVNYPQVTKSGGLQTAIIKYLEWSGYRSTRINVAGRMVDGKYIHSTTRRGTADISCTIRGRAVMLEIKIGKDKPSEYQLAEQQRERAAGGVYEFIKTIDEFFLWFDGFLLTL